MTFKGHCIFALASVILAKKVSFSPALAEGEWGIIALGALLSCLLPDIDHSQSFISRHLKIISFFTSYILKHRGFTHSILAVILYVECIHQFFPSTLIPYQDFQDAMIIGYVSHLVADILTPAGIPLLWPCPWRFCLPVLHPNSSVREILFCVLFLIYATVVIH
ncbi:metal-dependent hydrolase [Candidatus Liberibacter solanacearum]|nr:metal-dependent hydrolase [Candidatus Liberibacter solanacearum]